jgi:hypothetical protein
MASSLNEVEFWQHLLLLSEVFVYKIPPLATASGHQAEKWGLADPLFTGSLKMAQHDVKLRIVLYTPDGAEFGTCPIAVNPKEEGGLLRFVESVADSSRYFVLRLVDKDNEKRTAMIGIGFRERDAAFDFKNVMNEYVRYIDRSAKAEEVDLLGMDDLSMVNEIASTAAFVPTDKFTMKEGEKVHIGGLKPRSKPAMAGGGTGTGGGLGLAPPPPPGSTVFLKVPAPPALNAAPTRGAFEMPAPDELQEDLFAQIPTAQAQAAPQEAEEEEEFWGDFS